jgi:hypothetical protein
LESLKQQSVMSIAALWFPDLNEIEFKQLNSRSSNIISFCKHFHTNNICLLRYLRITNPWTQLDTSTLITLPRTINTTKYHAPSNTVIMKNRHYAQLYHGNDMLCSHTKHCSISHDYQH